MLGHFYYFFSGDIKNKFLQHLSITLFYIYLFLRRTVYDGSLVFFLIGLVFILLLAYIKIHNYGI